MGDIKHPGTVLGTTKTFYGIRVLIGPIQGLILFKVVVVFFNLNIDVHVGLKQM